MLHKLTYHHLVEILKIRKFYLFIISFAIFSINIPAQNGWTQKAAIPTQRAGACACVVDNKIYVLGGYSIIIGNFDINEVYDPSTDTWETKSALPQALGYLSCSVVDGIIYAIGGGYPTATNKMYAYNPATDTWTQKADMLSVRRSAQAVAVGGRIYNIGGNHGVTQPSLKCEAYDPSTDTWTPKTSIPAGGGNLALAVYNGHIYSFGGSINSPYSGFSYVYEYNPQTDTWTPKQSMPTARFGLQACTNDNKIYAIGGSQAQNTTLGTVEEYDPVNDTWEQGYNMPIKSVFLTGAVVNDKIYIMGGSIDWSTAGLQNVWEYDPSLVDVIQDFTTPTEFVLNQNYPNPFNPSTTIQYSIPQLSVMLSSFQHLNNSEIPKQALPTDRQVWGDNLNVTLKVFDILGREVATLVNQKQKPGNYEVTWDANNVPSGVYFYKLNVSEFTDTKKLILMK